MVEIKDEYYWIGDAIKDYNNLVSEYQYYQKWQTSLRKDYNNWPGPPESFYKETWKNSISEQIISNRNDLRYYEEKIKKIRKIIKKLNREQNAKFNKV